MQQLSNLIVDYFPDIATYFTGIVFVIFLILNISDDFDKISGFVKRIFNLRKHVDTLIYAKKRKKYNKTLYDNEYLKWQQTIIEKIYGDLITAKNAEFEREYEGKDFVPHIDFTRLNLQDKSQTYEAVTLRLKPVDYPFTDICSKEFLTRKKGLEDKENEIKLKYKKEVNKYYRLIKQTLKYPNRLGYMLDDIVFDAGNDKLPWYVTAHSGVYSDNLKTSHILEYELYGLYMKDKKHNWNIKDKSREEILDRLPIRKYIHEKFADEAQSSTQRLECEADILTSGRYRSSLLGVQMFVMVKNHAGSYDALRIRRSINVIAKPGFIQFIPSGGFEAANDCTDLDSQWDNYSITKAVFRELLEECFGMDEDDRSIAANNISPDKIYNNKHITELVHMLDSDDGRAHMQLMGTSMSLVGLRQELSFILRVDDPDFSLDFIGNYESRSAIHMIDVKVLEDAKFWMNDDLAKLNCTSAGLYELARESQMYKI